MPETIYKISSKDSDLYYLFINYNPTKNKLVLLHNLLQYYYRYMKDNNYKSKYNDAFIIFQQNNIIIELLDIEFDNKLNADKYIIETLTNDNNCVNYKNINIDNTISDKVKIYKEKTPEENKKLRNKMFYENNKQFFKQYYEKNKEKIKENYNNKKLKKAID
jgi:hypothetical protein